MIAFGPGGSRSIGADAFFVDLFENALSGSEILTEIRIPTPPATGSGGAYIKIERKVGDYTEEVEARLLLVHLIRENLNLTGTHIGCDTTQCGACTVMMDGRAVFGRFVLGLRSMIGRGGCGRWLLLLRSMVGRAGLGRCVLVLRSVFGRGRKFRGGKKTSPTAFKLNNNDCKPGAYDHDAGHGRPCLSKRWPSEEGCRIIGTRF